jgi:tetratricopeptide (TPR) repeat protein
MADLLDEARTRIEAGDPAGARPLLERAVADPARESEATVLLARAFNALGDWESGIRHGKRAVELLPEGAEARYRYAEALRVKLSSVSRMKAMLSLGDYKAAVQRAIELDPRHVGARREEIGYLTFAPTIAGGDLAKARRRIEELAGIDWRAATFCRAQLEAREGDDDAALATYAQVLDRHPDDAESRIELGLLLQRLGRYQEADAQFARLEGHPDRVRAANAIYQRGRSRVLGDWELEQAAGFFERFLETAEGLAGVPSPSHAWCRLGGVYERLARKTDARRAYERALALDPDNGEARKALKALPQSG